MLLLLQVRLESDIATIKLHVCLVRVKVGRWLMLGAWQLVQVQVLLLLQLLLLMQVLQHVGLLVLLQVLQLLRGDALQPVCRC